MTGPAIDDEQSSVHRRALQLRRHLVDLDTAAQMLDLVDPDRDAPTDPPHGLHELAAVADQMFTQYLIDHRNVLGRMRFWDVDYQLVDRDPRAIRTVTFDVGAAPSAGTVCRHRKPDVEP